MRLPCDENAPRGGPREARPVGLRARGVVTLVLVFVSGLVLGGEVRAGELSVLSYNVRGLPAWLAGDRPQERLLEIGERIADYDVVLLQEDFAYHDSLLTGEHHETVLRGNGPQSWIPFYESGLCPWCGSGLTFLARAAPESVLEIDRVPFEICAGRFSRRLDCWVAKGFLRVRLEVAPGADVDVYDLHLDAGTTREDRRARERQLEQIHDHAARVSADRALIVGGDFNVWLDDPDDRRLLSQFVAALGLREAGIPLTEGARPPLDRIFYRGGRETRLELLDAGVDERFVRDGAPLSDHPAIGARFRVRSLAPTDDAAPSRDRRTRGKRSAAGRSRRRRPPGSPGGTG